MAFENESPQTERSLGELLSDLSRELSTLVREEAALARAELSQKISRVGKDVGFLAAGGAVAYAGLLAIVAALVLLLAQVMPAWGAALLVGVIVAGIGAFLVWKGLDAFKHEDLVPRQTIETLKEDRNVVTGTRRRAA